MKKNIGDKSFRRGKSFVEEPTGSATMVNLDGRTEHRSAFESRENLKESPGRKVGTKHEGNTKTGGDK